MSVYEKILKNGNKVIVDAAIRDEEGKNIKNNYAKQRGSYPFLSSGRADNLNATVGNIDDSVWTLRTTGGSTSVNDGFANIKSINGVNGGTNVKSLKTIGFNAFNKAAGYAFVLGGKEYCVSGTYASLGFAAAIGGAITPITTTTATTSTGVEYQSYTPAENGYVYVTDPSAYMCISLAWSGYRVADYEDYWEDSLTIDSKNYFPDGMHKAKYAYDELNSEKAIKRIGSYTFTGSETLTQTGTTKEVPAGYAQLEYIEATGTQWLDTGLNATSALGFYRFEVKYASTSTAGGWHMMAGCSNPDAYFGFNGTSVGGGSFNLVYPDGTPVAGNNTAYRVIATGNRTGSYTYALFGQKNGASTVQNLGIGRMYYCSIYQLNTTTGAFDLIKRFIPAKRENDGVLGMYETVSQTFVTNSGTGDFIASAATVHFHNTYSITDGAFDVRTNTTNVAGQSAAFSYGQVDTSDTPSGYTRLESIDFNQWNSTVGFGNGLTFPYTITQIRKVVLDVQADSSTNSMILAAATSKTVTPGTTSPYINMTGQSGHSGLTRTVSTVAGFYGRVQAEFTWTTTSGYYLVFGHWNAEEGWRFAGHLYGVKLYGDAAGTTLLADYLPVKRDSDNKVGLYDKISGEFLTNTYNKELGYTIKTLANGNNVYGSLNNIYIQAYDAVFPTASSILSELAGKYIRWEKSQYEAQTSAIGLRYRISDFGIEELILESGASTPDLTILYQMNLRDTVQRAKELLEVYAALDKSADGDYLACINNGQLEFSPITASSATTLSGAAACSLTINGKTYRIPSCGDSPRAANNVQLGPGSYTRSDYGDGMAIGTNAKDNTDLGGMVVGGNSRNDSRFGVSIGPNTVNAGYYGLSLGYGSENRMSYGATFDFGGTRGFDSNVNRILHLKTPANIFFRNENVSTSKNDFASYSNGAYMSDLLYHKNATSVSAAALTLYPQECTTLSAQAADCVISLDASAKLPTTGAYVPEYSAMITTVAPCIITLPADMVIRTNDSSHVIVNSNIMSLANGITVELNIQNGKAIAYVW